MRKSYIDNLRWMTVLLVIIYHVFYLFNSAGVYSNIKAKGIPQLDVILTFVYPWFMVLMFVLAGMSARYSLEKRSAKEFLKERAVKLLIPSIGATLCFGWISGYVTATQNNLFKDAVIPGIVKYLIYSSMGMGPLWFAHELFLVSTVLLIILAIDKKDKLWDLGGRCKIFTILLLVFLVWGSSFLLNMPVITTYRNGIYLVTFLLGYYVFSHEEIQELLKRYYLPFILVGIVMGVSYCIFYYGKNYTSDECLQSFFTNIYTWIMVLGLIGCAQVFFVKENKFTKFMKSRNFYYYIVHYPLLVLSAYIAITFFRLPTVINYIICLMIGCLLTVGLTEIVIKIPVLRFWAFGIRKKKNES